MQDVEIIGMIKSYIKKTLVGMGALKGAPCEVSDITSAAGQHTVTMTWEDSEGNTYTDSFTVKDGKDGTGGSSALTELTDVDFTDLDDEQMIFYNETDEKFENVDAGAVSETAYSAIASLLS